jgi:uncharacterized protein YbaP (TraB family)
MRRLSLGGKGHYASGPSAEIGLHARALLPAALAVLLGACASVPPPPVETGQLFLWEVAREDGQGGVAHLLGSVHMAEDALAFDPAVERALAESDTLVLEIDPEELAPTEMAELTLEKGHFTDGRTLDQVLAPEAWAALEARAAALGLPSLAFQPMEPWLALITLQVMALQREGFDSGQGVETVLAQTAEEEGKPTLGLETAESQLGVFDALPLELQTRMLDEFLLEREGGDDADEQLSLLIDAWKKGDAERLEAEVFGELERDPSFAPYFELFYYERNRNMAHGIAELVDGGGSWFVAVGAAHVVGAQGIPSLLTERGYAVRRVPKTGH